MISLSGAISIRQASQWPLLRIRRHISRGVEGGGGRPISRVVEGGGELQGPKVKWRQGGWRGEGGRAKGTKEAGGRLKKTRTEKRRYRVRETESHMGEENKDREREGQIQTKSVRYQNMDGNQMTSEMETDREERGKRGTGWDV